MHFGKRAVARVQCPYRLINHAGDQTERLKRIMQGVMEALQEKLYPRNLKIALGYVILEDKSDYVDLLYQV